MVYAFNAGSYPWFGMNPPDEELREAWDDWRAGKGDFETVESLWDQMTTIVVAEQSRAFIDRVTDGCIRRERPSEWYALGIEGAVAEGCSKEESLFVPQDWDGTFKSSWMTSSWLAAEDTAQKPLLVVLPNPWTFVCLAGDGGLGRLERWTKGMVSKMAQLAGHGAKHFVLELPDLSKLEANEKEAITKVINDLSEQAPKGSVFIALPPKGYKLTDEEAQGTHRYVNCLEDTNELEAVLESVEENKPLVLGVFDHESSEIIDAAVVAEQLEPYRQKLAHREIWVGPTGPLGELHRDDAFDKLLQLRYLTEQLNRDWSA